MERVEGRESNPKDFDVDATTVDSNTASIPSSDQQKKRSGGSSGFWAAFWIILIFGGLAGVGYWKRHVIYERFPAVERFAATVNGMIGRGGAGSYQPIATDQEGMGVDYLDSAPMREYSQIPAG